MKRFQFPVFLIALLVLAGGWRQTSRPATTPVSPRNPEPAEADADRPLLAGPAVEPEARIARRVERDRPRRVNPRRWFETLRTLDLTPPQRVAIRSTLREFETKRRVFRREHGQKLAELRRAMRAARSTDQPVPREILARVAAIDGLAPRPETYQERVWELLTEPQRSVFRKRLSVATVDAPRSGATETPAKAKPSRGDTRPRGRSRFLPPAPAPPAKGIPGEKGEGG